MFKKKKVIISVDICIEKDGASYHAFCPALKGVHVDGETEQEALENVQIAITLYIKSLMKHGEPIPLQICVEEKEQQPSARYFCPPQHTQNILVTV